MPVLAVYVHMDLWPRLIRTAVTKHDLLASEALQKLDIGGKGK